MHDVSVFNNWLHIQLRVRLGTSGSVPSICIRFNGLDKDGIVIANIGDGLKPSTVARLFVRTLPAPYQLSVTGTH